MGSHRNHVWGNRPYVTGRCCRDVRPSKLPRCQSLGSREIATLRGTALHMLLEHLAAMPVDRRTEAGDLLVAHLHAEAGFAPIFDLLPAIRGEALALVNAPALAHVFAPDTLAEIPVTADLPGIGRIHGVIDRLIVTPDTVTAIDFKSNRVEPQGPADTPEGLLRQMGAYAASLQQVYPGPEDRHRVGLDALGHLYAVVTRRRDTSSRTGGCILTLRARIHTFRA